MGGYYQPGPFTHKRESLLPAATAQTHTPRLRAKDERRASPPGVSSGAPGGRHPSRPRRSLAIPPRIALRAHRSAGPLPDRFAATEHPFPCASVPGATYQNGYRTARCRSGHTVHGPVTTMARHTRPSGRGACCCELRRSRALDRRCAAGALTGLSIPPVAAGADDRAARGMTKAPPSAAPSRVWSGLRWPGCRIRHRRWPAQVSRRPGSPGRLAAARAGRPRPAG